MKSATSSKPATPRAPAAAASAASAADALTRLTLLVFKLNGALLEAGDRLCAPVGQTSARWQVLGVVDHGPASVSAVARIMGLARQSVQRTADRLAEDGLVAYVENPGDKRAALVTLTKKGRRALRSIEAAQAKWAKSVGERVGAAALARALESLERLEAELDPESERARRLRTIRPGE